MDELFLYEPLEDDLEAFEREQVFRDREFENEGNPGYQEVEPEDADVLCPHCGAAGSDMYDSRYCENCNSYWEAQTAAYCQGDMERLRINGLELNVRARRTRTDRATLSTTLIGRIECDTREYPPARGTTGRFEESLDYPEPASAGAGVALRSRGSLQGLENAPSWVQPGREGGIHVLRARSGYEQDPRAAH